jgi:hypothetical protein
VIDGLSGEPLIDTNEDGRITLGELVVEVGDAMRHMEAQSHGYSWNGLAVDFTLAKTKGSRPRAADAKFPIGSYVSALDDGRRRIGRVVAVKDDEYTVQFYDYSDKRTSPCPADELKSSTGDVAPPQLALDVGMKPDCEVEWQGTWYPAKVLKTANGKYHIHYVGYEASWDEWVGSTRIRLFEKKAQP